MTWRMTLMLLAGIALGWTESLVAAEYPDRPVRIVVPNPPGGANDSTARLLAPRLAAALGQPVIIDNRPGSNGNIASESVARAAPDGHTLLLAVDAQIVVNPHVYTALAIDPFTDLVPVATVAATRMMLAINAEIPAKDLRSFIELARKANPPLAYASIGYGSMHHLTMEMLKAAAGIELLHIPYKGGGPATQALIAGDVAAMLGGNSLSGQIRAGAVRPLAAVSRGRSRQYPELPSLSEHYPGVSADSWIGIFAPAGLPGPVLGRLRSALASVVAMPEFAQELARAGGLEVLALAPDEFSALVASDYAKYGRLIKAIGVKLD